MKRVLSISSFVLAAGAVGRRTPKLRPESKLCLSKKDNEKLSLRSILVF